MLVELDSKMVIDILKGKILKPSWALIDVINEIKGINLNIEFTHYWR